MENKQTINDSSDLDGIKKEEETSISKNENIFKIFASHLKSVLDLYTKQRDKLSNADLIASGRSDEEKEMIQDACESIDKQYELLNEVRTTGMQPREWLEKESDNIFHDCSDEEVMFIQDLLNQDSQETIEAQTEAFKDIVDNMMPIDKEDKI